MGVVVVGSGSLIAGALRAHAGAAGWRFLRHAEALDDGRWLDGADVVLNCAFDPRLKAGPYESRFDVDLRLAGMLRERPGVRYVMLSSRLAYGPADEGHPCLVEARDARPTRPYGLAKLTTEQALQAGLGARLTILRLANVFGAEYQPGRQNFLAIALRSLREQGRIRLDMNPAVERDFVPVEELAEMLVRVVRAPQGGLFNLGAGHGTPTGHIAHWLVEGYGSGEVVVDDMRTHDAFWLDLAKARAAFGIEPVPADVIRARCLGLGRQLKELGRSAA